MYIHYALVNCSLWNNEQPENTGRSLWPIFHGLVILLNICNTIRHIYFILLGIYLSNLDEWVTVILQMTSYYRQVSVTYIFHGWVILAYNSNTI